MWKLSEGGTCSDRIEEKKEKLSEGGASSDSIEEKKEEVVRRWYKFGQDRGKKGRSCPKVVQVRTGSKKKRKKLSEGGASSDRIEEKKEKVVRRGCKFGQDRRK